MNKTILAAILCVLVASPAFAEGTEAYDAYTTSGSAQIPSADHNINANIPAESAKADPAYLQGGGG
jgi:hypothetical protein